MFPGAIGLSGGVEKRGRDIAGAVEDAKDSDAIVRGLVKDHMVPHGEVEHSWPQVVARCSDFRELRESLTGLLEPLNGSSGTRPTKSSDVVVNIIQIPLGFASEMIATHGA
jgi:hypothetical protein